MVDKRPPDAGEAPQAAPRSGPTSTPIERVTEPPESPPERARQTPLLASEALIEDLAPREPGRNAARGLCVGLGLALVAAGGLLDLRGDGALADQTVPSALLGGVVIVAGVLPVSYARRALALAVVGLLAGALGLRDIGPAGGIAVGGEAWGFFRFLAATALPAALLFRARYRAYGPARWFLGGAFLVATPFVVHAFATVATEELRLTHVGAVAAVAATLASLAGFMGAETTGAGGYLGIGLVIAFGGQLGLELLERGGAPPIDALATVLGFLAACTMVSVGMFQLLAARFSADARRIDPRSSREKKPPRRPPPEENDGSGFLGSD